jgi:hypothetical protein
MNMKRKKVVLAGVLCILAGGAVFSCYHSDYDHIKPSKLGTVTIPEAQMTVSLLCKSAPRASMITPYEGEYRILEVVQRNKSPLYVDLPGTIPGDRCRMEIYWYSTNNLLRIKDTQLTFAQEFRSECLLDLGKEVLYSVIRAGDRTYMAKLSVATHELNFPKSTEKERVPHSYGGSVSALAKDPSEIISIGEQEAKLIDASWTKSPGILVGVIGIAP